MFSDPISPYKEMGKFAGWNIWGNMAAMLFGTGINMLLNVFFGPVVNAARGIAVLVESAVAHFPTNFLMAVNPQITKLYAQNKLKEMHTLLFRASRFAYFLMFALTLPIVMETKSILTLWLKIVKDYTVIFLRLLLVIVIIDAVARPLMTSAAATGNVKKYQSVIGGILLSIVPIAYIVLKFGGSPASVYVVYLCVSIVAFVSRLLIIRPMIHLSLRQYAQNVVLRIIMVTVVSFSVMLIVRTMLPSNLFGVLAICIISIFTALLISYSLGLTTKERNFVRQKVVDIVNKVKR